MSDGGANLGSALAGGLGSLFGGLASYASTQEGIGAVQDMTNVGAQQIAPYNYTGANYLGPIASDLMSGSAASGNIGQDRLSSANPVDFEDFAKNYNTSQGAQYLMKTAATAQDDSAAAKGGLLSGANLRAQNTQQMGIANQDLTQQYNAMLQGQQQNFTQQEQSYQNLYGQEAMGLQAGIAEAGTYAQGARAVGSLYGTQAQQANQSGNSIGSALGNVFGAIAKLFPGT